MTEQCNRGPDGCRPTATQLAGPDGHRSQAVDFSGRRKTGRRASKGRCTESDRARPLPYADGRDDLLVLDNRAIGSLLYVVECKKYRALIVRAAGIAACAASTEGDLPRVEGGGANRRLPWARPEHTIAPCPSSVEGEKGASAGRQPSRPPPSAWRRSRSPSLRVRPGQFLPNAATPTTAERSSHAPGVRAVSAQASTRTSCDGVRGAVRRRRDEGCTGTTTASPPAPAAPRGTTASRCACRACGRATPKTGGGACSRACDSRPPRPGSAAARCPCCAPTSPSDWQIGHRRACSLTVWPTALSRQEWV